MASRYEYTSGSSSEDEADETKDRAMNYELASLRKQLKEQAAKRLEAEFRLIEQEEGKEFTTHSDSPSSHSNVVPEKYDGKTDVISYLKHFEACRRLNGWDKKVAKRWLASRLMGNATKILDGPIES